MPRPIGQLVLPGMIFTALVGTVHLILPAAALFLFALRWRTPYRTVVDAVEKLWLSGAAAMLETFGSVRIRTSGDDAPVTSDKCVVVILNHNCRLDWMFFWCLLDGPSGHHKKGFQRPYDGTIDYWRKLPSKTCATTRGKRDTEAA